MKKLSLFMFAALVAAIIAMGNRCNLAKSDLISDTSLTVECKIAIEAMYYNQKHQDKSAIVETIRACKESNRYLRCVQYINNRTLFAECKELLK